MAFIKTQWRKLDVYGSSAQGIQLLPETYLGIGNAYKLMNIIQRKLNPDKQLIGLLNKLVKYKSEQVVYEGDEDDIFALTKQDIAFVKSHAKKLKGSPKIVSKTNLGGVDNVDKMIKIIRKKLF